MKIVFAILALVVIAAADQSMNDNLCRMLAHVNSQQQVNQGNMPMNNKISQIYMTVKFARLMQRCKQMLMDEQMRDMEGQNTMDMNMMDMNPMMMGMQGANAMMRDENMMMRDQNMMM